MKGLQFLYEVKEKANKAKQGTWQVEQNKILCDDVEIEVNSNTIEQSVHNANFIAIASPKNVQILLDMLDYVLVHVKLDDEQEEHILLSKAYRIANSIQENK